LRVPGASDLDRHLDELARAAQPGERLPTIRELMRRFGVSQVVVQRAFDGLKARGLISSHVGRGTHFVTPGAVPAPARSDAALRTSPAVKSVLLLRRSMGIARGRVLIEGLQRRFAADGHRVLEVSYTDPEHARSMLKGLPRFDACIVQSSFRAIPIELLAALRERSDVLAVDGAALIGTDVEAVGMEWGEPLAQAVARLRAHGHARIAVAMSSHPLLATQLGWRRFEALQQALGEEASLRALPLPQDPGEEYETALAAAIESAGAGGALPFSALVAWGVEDGERLRARLAARGIGVPAALSVVLLGRTDLVNEHAGFFDTVGCSVADQIESLRRAVLERWADPARPYGVQLVPVTARAGASVAALPQPPTATRARARRSRS
jgi:DNA-binding transcriptional regulator YhcF (GntR family)